MSSALPNCHTCQSESVVKNGFIHNGKQNHLCKDCGRQFVEASQNKVISDETKALIDKLLLEKIPLAGIARVVDVSEPWLQGYVNEKYASVSHEVNVLAKKRGLTIQCDEAWSFVGNKQWIWLAIDEASREIVGLYVGRRNRSGARGLWVSLPPVYRQCAVT